MMDMSKTLNYPTSQFEGDETLEKAMKEARVGSSESCLYAKYNGESGLLEHQHHLEMSSLKARQAREVLEFHASAKEENESRMLFDLLNRGSFGFDTFPESLTDDM